MILADEATGNLDTTRSKEIMDLLCQLHRDRGLTIVMVTHEYDMAAYTLLRRPGVALARPADLHDPDQGG